MTAPFRLPRTARPRRYELELRPDLEQASFEGHVEIVVDVAEATPVLVLNAAGLEVASAVLFAPGGSERPAGITLDPVEQQLSLDFGADLEPGEGYRLQLEFSGRLNDQLAGFYRSAYTDETGVERAIATTQFEPSDARRAFPCWDEPDFKAVFAISLVIDDSLHAISNGPVASVEPRPGGRKRVSFADTMEMSTYVVAFVVGPYESTEPVDVDGVPLRIVAVPGKAHLTGYAERSATHALSYLARYFEIPYPGAKIDHIAVPDFAFGAMENLGCVIYRENVLLADEALASQSELQRIALVVAHETAHMWFGDLVTMKWWNGIWLNEAFATFMENLAVDDFAPEWQIWSTFQGGKAMALATDGLHATRPVEYTVGRPEEAEAMFDVLTYQKGGAVLRMLEQYLGAETFRRGLVHYLTTHAHGNTETADLWDALEEVSGEPVRTMMDSWILQSGYPLIEVEATGEPGSVRLQQRRFSYSEPTGTGGEAPTEWVIPLTVRASVGGAVQRQRVLLDGSTTTLTFDGPLDWLVVNDGAWGFYRSRYTPALLAALGEADVRAHLDPLERFGLLNDSWATVTAGLANLSDWVSTAAFVAADDDPDVWGAALAVLAQLALLAGDDESPAVDAFIERLAGPVWATLGWEPADGESQRRAMARARVLNALALVEGPSPVKSEAAERLSAFLAGGQPMAPDLVGVAARIAVKTLGRPVWQAVCDRYLSATVAQERLRYLTALAEARQPDLLLGTLDFGFTDDVRIQDAPFLLASAMAHRGGTRVTWDWLEQNWERVQSRLPSSLLLRVIEGASAVFDADLAATVERVCAQAAGILSGPRIDQVIERVHVNVTLANRLRGTLATGLSPL